jgi:hypothetical protein
MKAKERKTKKRKEAEQRQEIRERLSDCQQLAVLSTRRGESARERARLEARIIASEKAEKEVVKPVQIWDEKSKRGKKRRRNRKSN